MVTGPQDDNEYGDQEAAHRVERALRAAFKSPHKTYEQSKVGNRKASAPKSHRRRKAVKKRNRSATAPKSA
jgi:hypothetical protein